MQRLVNSLGNINWTRKMQLARGRWWQLRGLVAGERFGVGRSIRIEYFQHLTVGDDVMIDDFSFLHCLSERGVHIGNSTSFDRNLWLHCGGTPGNFGHGYFEIGENSYVGCNAVLGAGGGIRIGNNVLIGQSVNIHAEQHQFEDPNLPIKDQGVDYQQVIIEDDVWIGSKATILGGVTIGKGAVIGAGAVVTKSIPGNMIAVGVPARPIEIRNKKDNENYAKS